MITLRGHRRVSSEKGRVRMILVQAVLQCDECGERLESCEVVTEPSGYQIPVDASGRATIPDWSIHYGERGIGRVVNHVLNAGVPPEPPQVTCSEDCRKVIDARGRLAVEPKNTGKREPINKPQSEWRASGGTPFPTNRAPDIRCPRCLFHSCMCDELAGE